MGIFVAISSPGLTQPWAVVLAALVGAIFTGLFALWQSVRNAGLQKSLAESNASAQGKLEKYKSDLALTRTQLELSRRASHDFRVERLTPFLEALNNAIVDSYSAVVGLPIVAKFKLHIPAIVTQRDKDMAAWMHSMQAMSRLRVQALLSIEDDAIEPLIRSIEQFVQLQKRLITTRSNYLSDQASYEDVVSAHSDYVRAGFALLLAARGALAADAGASAKKAPAPDREDLFKDLPELLERSSIVSLSYGAVPHNAWIATWTLSESVLEHEGLSGEKFDQAVAEVARALYALDDALDVKLVRLDSDYALCVAFADKASMEAFVKTHLPAIKRQTRPLWKGLVAPVEMLVE